MLSLPLLLGFAVYASAIQLPFFSDDVLHFRYAAEVTARDIWTKRDVTALYYRPVVNTLLHLGVVQWGVPLNPAVWHLILLLNHVLNTALVGALARQLGLRTSGQLIAMLLFAVFPFSPQAVVWILAWFHPIVTTAILIFVVAALRALRQPRAWGWVLAAWLAGSIAPFIHENGLFALGYLGMTVLTVYSWRGVLERWRSVMLVSLMPAVGGVLYWLVRSALSGGTPAVNLGHLYENLAFFGQALSYPAQLVLGALYPATTEANIGLAWLGFAAFGVLLVIALWRQWRWLGFGLGWWLLASLPAAISLLPGYVVQSERLLYLAAPGAALVMAAALMQMRVVRLAGSLMLVAASLWFIQGYMTRYHQLGAGYNDMRAALVDITSETPLLLVNAPMQIDAEHYTLPMTRRHAFMLHTYIPIDDFLWLNTGGRRFQAVRAAEVPGLKRPVADSAVHYYGEESPSPSPEIAESAAVMVFDVEPNGDIQARWAGRRWSPLAAEGDSAFLADFNETVRLEAVTTRPFDANLVRVTLRWHKIGEGALPHVVFVHLTCDDVMIDQSDGAPLASLHPFAAWSVGEIWEEDRYFEVDSTAEDCLSLRIGLYRQDTGERAVVTNHQGQHLPQGWVVVPFVKT
ncbi:MAG: hypothetical protein OHK0046_05440 [Anaerolineae bacterium]